MPGGYSIVDTLTLQWPPSDGGPGPGLPGVEPSSAPLPVLARIPAARTLDPLPADASEPPPVDSPDIGVSTDEHLPESLSESLIVLRADPAHAPDSPAAPSDDTPPIPAPLTIPDEALTEPSAEPDESEPGLVNLLGRLETAIAPYTPVIVLLTLVAAAGLTVMLLRGGPAATDDRAPAPPTDSFAQPAAPTSDLTAAPSLQSPGVTPVAVSVRGPVGSSPAYSDANVAPHAPIPAHRVADSAPTLPAPKTGGEPEASTKPPRVASFTGTVSAVKDEQIK